MATRTNSQFLAASLTEFLSVWSVCGDACLNLTTKNGLANVQFNCTLGHPGALHSLSPTPSPTSAPPPHRPRHRGPAARERNRQRAARHQEARTAASATSSPSDLSVIDSVTASSSPSPATESTAENSGATVSVTKTASSEAEISTSFQCDKCDFVSISEHGVKIHYGTKHKESQKPEQFRAESLDNSLIMTPVKESREEDTSETNSPVLDNYLDSTKEKSDSEDEHEKYRKERSKKLDDFAKTEGSWCYECNDRCANRTALKMHMKNDHGMDIYPELDMILHGGW